MSDAPGTPVTAGLRLRTPRPRLRWWRADEVTPGWAAAYPVVMDEEEA